LIGNGVGQNLEMNKTGLRKGVVSLSLVVTEVSRAGGIKW